MRDVVRVDAMAKTVKVPFELHGALKPRAAYDLPEGIGVTLHADGRTAAIVSGRWTSGRLLFLDLTTGVIDDVMPGRTAVQHFAWAPTGERWAASSEVANSGVLHVGERGRAALLCDVPTPAHGAMGRNDLTRPSPVVALSHDGARVVMRACIDHGKRSVIYHLDVATSALREQVLDVDEGHPYAQYIRDDGALVTLSADPGDTSGMAVYMPGDARVCVRRQHVAGYAIVPTKKGLWALGLPRYCHHVAPGKAVAPSECHDDRLQRVARLAGRARSTWDQQHIAWLTERVTQREVPFNYTVSALCARAGSIPPPTEGVRSHENVLLWDTARVARWGDEDVIVSDGIGVWCWHQDEHGLRQDLLVDDPQHATHRTARIVGLSVAGDTLALLWKKDANGAKTVLMLFDINPALATG